MDLYKHNVNGEVYYPMRGASLSLITNSDQRQIALGTEHFIPSLWYFYDKCDTDGAPMVALRGHWARSETTLFGEQCRLQINLMWPPSIWSTKGMRAALMHTFVSRTSEPLTVNLRNANEFCLWHICFVFLLLYIIGSTAMNACVALEDLSHIERMINILESGKEMFSHARARADIIRWNKVRLYICVQFRIKKAFGSD